MICIYDIGNEDFEGNGNAVLTPTEGTVKQEAGGNYDLTLTQPMDAEGKWRHIVPGAIVKAPVPREVIENAFAGYDADVYKTTVKAEMRESASEPSVITYPAWREIGPYEPGSQVTFGNKNYQCTYYDHSSIEARTIPPYSAWWFEIARTTPGAPVVVTLPAGTDLYLVEDVDANWYKMATYYGIEGYVKKSAVAYDRHLTPAEVQPRIITEQLFRLQKPTIDNEKRTVTVTGQHVSYDLAGILTESLSIVQAKPGLALGRIMDSLMIPYRGTIATDLGNGEDAGTYTGDTSGKNGMYMLMDPDKGIINAFGAKFTRDNWDLFVMKKSDEVSSYRIIYGKNMRGVTWKQDSSGIITRVVPVAKSQGGEDLYLPEKWVDSPHISEYPVIRMERLKVNGQVGKDKGLGDGSTWTESDLLDYMREKAEERYSIDHADEIVHELTVQFEQIGDTAEYPWLKGLESVLLYDNIRCTDQNIGLEKTLTVSAIEWDIIRRKIRGIKLSNITGGTVRSVTGYHVQNNSISPAKLTDDVAGGILDQVKDIIPEYADPEAARPGTVTVTDGDPTLSWGTRSTVGTIGGSDIHVTLPANPDTWRPVQDNLNSSSATDALSANQGRVLNSKLTPEYKTLEYKNGVTDRSGRTRLIKIGDIIILNISVNASSIGAGETQILQFDSTIAPAQLTFAPGVSNTRNVSIFNVGADGAVKVGGHNQDTVLSGTITWVVGK